LYHFYITDNNMTFHRFRCCVFTGQTSLYILVLFVKKYSCAIVDFHLISFLALDRLLFLLL